MFNPSYMLLTKALSLHLKYILPNISMVEYTIFIYGRYILDNVIIVWEDKLSHHCLGCFLDFQTL
jgi:hypothetical protein